MRSRATEPLLIWLAAVGAIALVYASLLLGQDTVDFLIREGGLYETLGALALLVAAILFLLAFRRSGDSEAYGRVKRLSLLALALILFLGAAEEVSWGQQIFDYPTPAEIREVNAQEEFNFHNLEALDGALDPTFLFKVFWASFAVLIPLACAVSSRLRQAVGSLIPILPVWLAGLFVANQLFAELTSVILGGSTAFNGSYSLDHSRLETTEGILGVLFAIAAYIVYRDAREQVKQPVETAERSHPAAAGGIEKGSTAP